MKNNFVTPAKSTVKANPKKMPTLKESDFKRSRVAASFRPSLYTKVFEIEMIGLTEYFTKNIRYKRVTNHSY